MDVIYDVRQIGANRLLFNETVSVVDPFFLCVLTNPWTKVSKTAHIIPEGTDSRWIINIIGIAEAYQDLLAGEVYFDNIGTWECDVYLNEVVASALIRNLKLQVIDL